MSSGIQQNQLAEGRPFFLEVIDVLKAIQMAPRMTIAYGAFVKSKGWGLVQELSEEPAVAAGNRSNMVKSSMTTIGWGINIHLPICGENPEIPW